MIVAGAAVVVSMGSPPGHVVAPLSIFPSTLTYSLSIGLRPAHKMIRSQLRSIPLPHDSARPLGAAAARQFSAISTRGAEGESGTTDSRRCPPSPSLANQHRTQQTKKPHPTPSRRCRRQIPRRPARLSAAKSPQTTHPSTRRRCWGFPPPGTDETAREE